MPERPDDHLALSPLDQLLGLRLVEASADVVVTELTVTERLMQPHGIVHGGVYCAIIETATSVGAAMQAGLEERVVGISNHTRFIRAVNEGTLTCRATPEAGDGDVLTWKAVVTDEAGRLVAEGLVNLLRLKSQGASRIRSAAF
jgi:uncharacterized protein (TIGR00369 family)